MRLGIPGRGESADPFPQTFSHNCHLRLCSKGMDPVLWWRAIAALSACPPMSGLGGVWGITPWLLQASSPIPIRTFSSRFAAGKLFQRNRTPLSTNNGLMRLRRQPKQ
jgi:hypothetical protein